MPTSVSLDGLPFEQGADGESPAVATSNCVNFSQRASKSKAPCTCACEEDSHQPLIDQNLSLNHF